jgi:hypothetical protein
MTLRVLQTKRKDWFLVLKVEGDWKDQWKRKVRVKVEKGSVIKRDVLWYIVAFFNTLPIIIISQIFIFIFSPNVAINYTWYIENKNNEYWVIFFLAKWPLHCFCHL